MKIIKIINHELIEISDYRCSAILFPEVPPTIQNNKDQIEHCEDWCVFKETINPFQLYAENFEKDNEIDRLNNIINECANDILKELKENSHLSYGVALSIRQKLIDYKELKDSDNNVKKINTNNN